MPLAVPAAFSKPEGAELGLPRGAEPGVPKGPEPGLEDAPLLSVLLNVWSAMIARSVGILLRVILRFKSGGDGAFRYAPDPLSDVLRGIAQCVRREALRFGLPDRLVIGVPDSLRSRRLSTFLDRIARRADQSVLDLGARKRPRDQTADQQADTSDHQRILFDGFEHGLAGALGEIRRGIARRLHGI